MGYYKVINGLPTFGTALLLHRKDTPRKCQAKGFFSTWQLLLMAYN